MKKALSILLVIALSALFFTGCGESPSASGDADAVDPTPTGDVIADLFCGSGTSIVVAKELNRQYIGCDINPRAIEITNNRLKEIG